MVLDQKSFGVYYPSSGSSAQVLAMNAIPTIEVNIENIKWIFQMCFQGHTSDGGFVVKFEEGTSKRNAAQNNKKKWVIE